MARPRGGLSSRLSQSLLKFQVLGLGTDRSCQRRSPEVHDPWLAKRPRATSAKALTCLKHEMCINPLHVAVAIVTQLDSLVVQHVTPAKNTTA